MADTAEASMEASGVRMASETFSPFTYTCWTPFSYPSSRWMPGRQPETASPSWVSFPARRTQSPMARYIAPVSTYKKPSALAAARAMVLLPAPAGPSIATEIM